MEYDKYTVQVIFTNITEKPWQVLKCWQEIDSYQSSFVDSGPAHIAGCGRIPLSCREHDYVDPGSFNGYTQECL